MATYQSVGRHQDTVYHVYVLVAENVMLIIKRENWNMAVYGKRKIPRLLLEKVKNGELINLIKIQTITKTKGKIK